MPFQQLGFSPYPTAPRRNLEAYKGFGEGIRNIGAGMSTALGSFQEMKERRMKNLLLQERGEQARTKSERDELTAKTLAETKKAEADAKEKWETFQEQQIKNKMEFEVIDQQAKEAQKDRESNERIALQKFAGSPLAAASGATPTPSPGISGAIHESQAAVGAPSPQGFQPPPPPTLGLTPGESERYAQKPMDAQTYALKAKSLGQKVDPTVMEYLFPFSGEKAWVPRTKEEDEAQYLFEQKNKAFSPKGGKGAYKKEQDPKYVMSTLDALYENQIQLQKEAELLTEELYTSPAKGAFGMITDEDGKPVMDTNKIKRQSDKAKLRKAFMANKVKIANHQGYYQRLMGQKYISPSIRKKAQAHADEMGITFDEALNLYRAKKAHMKID